MNDPAKIRNIALVGHRGTGKTSLFEALLFGAGAVTRLGSVADGTTVSDWDDDEKKRQMSLSAGLAQVDHGGLSYNLVDTPGDSSFLADAIASLEVVETALMVVNTVLGVEVQTERLWDRAAERGLARMLVCNMLDRERADFDAAVAALQEAFGAQVVAVQLPIGSEHDFSGVVDLLSMKAYTYADGKGSEGEVPAELADAAATAREKLIDAVASTDDDLAEKYLMEEEITADELNAAFAAAVATAQIFPVACVAATAGIGADRLFDVLALAPSPADVPARAVLDGEDSVELACDPSRPAVAFVFKTLADPFSGHVNVFRVFQGTMNSDSQLVVARDGHKERVGQLLRPRGKENKPVDALVAGDIGAVAKLKDVVTGDTLTAEAGAGAFPPIRFPAPLMSFAITAKSKGEEDKVISALRRLSEEDPMLEVHRDEQTGETIVGGMSQVHVEVTVERMKRRFGVEVELKPPRVPYRETIKGTAKAEGKHKKQTGGRGQFGVIYIDMEPLPHGGGFEFVDDIVGGAVPRQFIPAVEKGMRARMTKGVIAGYRVTDVKVRLFDGKFHDVDSDARSFEIAASKGFQAAFKQAKPCLLEPIMKIQVQCPSDCMGDVIGDLNHRRGRVEGMDSTPKGEVIRATVPMSETLKYSSDLRSITGGRGGFSIEFSHYDELPANLMEKVVAESKVATEEEE